MYNKILPLDKNAQMSWFKFANEIIRFTRSKANKAYLLDNGCRKIPVYCHMTSKGLDECEGGGWTLVMKIDGSKVFKVKCFHN